MATILTTMNNTMETAILNWTTGYTGEVSFEIWRAVRGDTDGHLAGTPAVSIGKLTNLYHYEDDTLKDLYPPTVPEIIKNTQTKRRELTINLKSREIGTMYEYWITSSKSETVHEDSNYGFATSTAGLKGYKYLVKRLINDKTEPVLKEEEKCIFSESDIINITDLEDGQYVFYAKSIDVDGNESEVDKVFFYIRNEHLDIEKHLNQVPVGVRYNNRYRGPHESKKVDFMYMQIKNNINKLKERVTKIASYVDVVDSKSEITKYINDNPEADMKTAMQQIKFDETSMIEKPVIQTREVLQTVEEIEVKLHDIREELKYEKRND